MVKRRSMMMLVVSIGFGLAAAWLARNWLAEYASPAQAAAADTVPVVVAALDIPFGQRIEDAHLRVIQWPKANVPKEVYNAAVDVQGKVASQRIVEGEVIVKSRIVEQLSGSTLAAIISPDKRALTVRVNDVIGVAGFLLPGNRVDVLATRKNGNKQAETRTLLKDLKVLAVDQTASPEKDKPIVVRAVTLEVDPKQAERLVEATAEGPVQLVLRNPVAVEEPAQPEPEKKQVAVRKSSVPAFDPSVTIIRGTNVDVSRVKM